MKFVWLGAHQHLSRGVKSSLICTLLTAFAWSAPSFLLLNPTASHAQDYWIAEQVEGFKYSGTRWIQIDLSTQTLTAWEGDVPVYSVLVSTGYSDPTPPGVFEIQSMHYSARMQGEGYDIPDVPFVMYYYNNYGIHGTYWHNNFGTPMSSGCVNLAIDHAEWLFYWAGIGTPVVVQD
jgi:lipoprotein-anchoring transpeptidase ErfK/SrfK